MDKGQKLRELRRKLRVLRRDLEDASDELEYAECACFDLEYDIEKIKNKIKKLEGKNGSNKRKKNN